MKKLQYHKIRNVAKNICTCEQKIAYNTAFDCYINFNFVEEYKAQVTEMYRKEIVFEFINKCMQHLKLSNDYAIIEKRYNIDAVQAALNHGAEKYLQAKHKNLSTYEEIGTMFPAPYL